MKLGFDVFARIPTRRHAHRGMGRIRALALACAVLGGCPDARSATPIAACTKAYEKCSLSAGVLGVCDPVECREGQTPPCLVCRSQH